MNKSNNIRSIKTTFEDNGYGLYVNDQEVRISKKHSFFAILFYAITFLITIPLLLSGEYQVLLLLILLIGFPLIYRRWMYPRKVVISNGNEAIYVNKNSKNYPVIPFKKIKNLEVDEKVISSDVSPFKEGYQDFVYNFKINTVEGKVHHLFDLEFRKPSDDVVKSVFDYLSEKINLTRQPQTVL